MDLNFAKFAAKWYVELPYPLPAGALLNLAEECEVHLAGETKRGRQTSLGKLLAAHIAVVVEHEGVRLTVRRGPFLSGKQFYKIENVH